MILMSMALLVSAAAAASSPATTAAPQCRTSEQMLTEAYDYLTRVQPMMANRQRLADRLARMPAGEGEKTGFVSLFSAGKGPTRLRETLISLGQQIEFERQSSAARIAALRLAC